MQGTDFRAPSVHKRSRQPIFGVLIAENRLNDVLVAGFALPLHEARIRMEDFGERDEDRQAAPLRYIEATIAASIALLQLPRRHRA